MTRVDPLEKLVHELSRLPAVGKRSARRLAFFLVKDQGERARALARTLAEAAQAIQWCTRCGNLADQELCRVCRDPRRDQGLICVVEDVPSLEAMEAAREFQGVYHVLGGVISPLSGIGPDQLRVRELVGRIAAGGVTEVIVASNPTVDGDATALYLSRLLKPQGVRITRIGTGMPMGSQLEDIDRLTLARALAGRSEL